ncbi:MAG: leucyl aminopeptidase family protein [Candidatus Aenigmatarchaeota archaeon]
MVNIKVEMALEKEYPLIEIIADERFGKDFLKGFNFKIVEEEKGKQIIYVSLLKNEMKLASKIIEIINFLKIDKVCIDVSILSTNIKKENFVESLYLSSYEFTTYKTKKDERKVIIKVYGIDRVALSKTKILSKAVYIARDLGNEPSNKLYPQAFVERVYEIFEDSPDIYIESLNEIDLEREKLEGILSVGNSSKNKPRLLILKYFRAEDRNQKPILLVGKGICFDAGGINVKPAEYMVDMYADKSGAAVVVGILYAVSKLGLPINIVATIPLAENVISESSIKQSDIIRIGDKNVEIVHTDAEGRLLIADAIQYGIKKFNPILIIDIATLTGAQIVALGYKIAALFSNDTEMSKKMFEVSKRKREYVWKMPIPNFYRELIKSERADIVNIKSPSSRDAGSIVGALFIKEFVKDKKWIHLDVAGPAISPKKDGWINKGSTGFGVRLITEFLLEISKSI